MLNIQWLLIFDWQPFFYATGQRIPVFTYTDNILGQTPHKY